MSPFDKPTKRSVINAVICYLLCFVLASVFALFLFWPTPPGVEPVGIPVMLTSVFVCLPIISHLIERGHHWLHPPVKKCYRQQCERT